MSRFVRSGRLCAPKPLRMPRVFPAGTEMDALLRRSAELDALQVAITRQIAAPNADLVCTYLPGLDLVQHGLFGSADASSASPASSAASGTRRALRALDALLGPAVSLSDDALLIVIASRAVTEPGQECCSSAAPPQTCACATATRGPPM